MIGTDDDPLIGFIDTPDKKARLVLRLRIAYIIWVIFLIIGFLVFLFSYLLS